MKHDLFVALRRLPLVFAWLLAAAAAQAAPVPLTVAGLPAGAPLVVTASHDGATLRILAELQDGWHLYARDVGGGQPVTVRVVGGAFASAGELATPADAGGLIRGKAELRLPLRRVADGGELRAAMAFMVCDALQCLPPIELELRSAAAAPPGPFRVLLVAVDRSERTERIAGFLRARGLQPTVTTYAEVTAELCDAHEVVVADSPTFGQLRGTKVDAGAFPATRSPVVAVGWLGTRLLAAHKVAMACGYI